jgi:phosphatidylinositol-4,5-bisphosphate 3-kinase
MGGRDSKQFEYFIQTCCKAYLILRKVRCVLARRRRPSVWLTDGAQHAHMFISLFMMMLSTGMPELQSVDDIKWLQKAFSLQLSDAEAEAEMRCVRVGVSSFCSVLILVVGGT